MGVKDVKTKEFLLNNERNILVNKREGKIDMCKAQEEQRLYDRTEGKAENTIEPLMDIVEPSLPHKKLIMNQTDLEIHRGWLKLAARAESIEDFEKKAGLLKQVYNEK